MRPSAKRRRVCFVTGSRAEFGLMQSVLLAIEAHPRLKLQLVVTGMHLDSSRGLSVREIRRAGFRIDATVRWPTKRGDPVETARLTG
ncbi:MAG: UDP-N-acetylglucosamine 2-epimerase (hydrolyzing), partial [Tepidisphaeraceae bacterium]